MFQYRKFTELKKIIEQLRGPEGCPWDKAQTHESLIKNLIEESYELVDAIENKDTDNTKEELGDVLLQVLLHSKISEDNKNFNIDDVVEELAKKLVRRHPHVFAEKKVNGVEEAHQSWLDSKALENKTKKEDLNSFNIPKQLPSLHFSQKMGRKMKKEGFDWSNNKQVIEKIKEELSECQEALTNNTANNTDNNTVKNTTNNTDNNTVKNTANNTDNNPINNTANNPAKQEQNLELKKEIGDLLFIVCQFARYNNIQAEEALRGANKKIEKRYFNAKNLSKKENLNWSNLDTKKQNLFWEKAKTLD